MKTLDKIKWLFAAAMVPGMMLALMMPVEAKAYCLDGTEKNSLSECDGYDKISGSSNDLNTTLKNIINTIIGVVGFVAVVMMIIGGISYTTSQGDSTKVKKAKDTIMYGIIGLVISMLSFAIVNFVLTNFFK